MKTFYCLLVENVEVSQSAVAASRVGVSRNHLEMVDDNRQLPSFGTEIWIVFSTFKSKKNLCFLTCTWWSFWSGDGPSGATPSSGGIKASFVPDVFIFTLDMFVALIKLLMLALRPFWPVAVVVVSRDDPSMTYAWFCCCWGCCSCCCCCCCWAMLSGGVATWFTFDRFTTSCAIVFSVDIDSLEGSTFAWVGAPDCCFRFAAGPLRICCCGDMRLDGDVRPLTAADWLLVGDTQLLSELLLLLTTLLLFMWFSKTALLLLLLLLCTAVGCCDWRSININFKKCKRMENCGKTHLKLMLRCCCCSTTLVRARVHCFGHSKHSILGHFRRSLKGKIKQNISLLGKANWHGIEITEKLC